MFVKKNEKSDFEEEQTMMKFEEFSNYDERFVVQEISIDPKFSVNQGPIKDALYIFYQIILSLKWTKNEIKLFIENVIYRFYSCKGSLIYGTS